MSLAYQVISALLYLLLVYALTSYWEHWFHRAVLHARRASRMRWRGWHWAGRLLRLAYFHHHFIHHRRTFRTSPFRQFDTPGEQARLNRRLARIGATGPQGDWYGASLSGPLQFATVATPPVLANVTLAFLVAPGMAWVGIGIGLLPLLISRYVHPMLHDLPARGMVWPILARGLRTTAAFRYLRRYHELHHRRGRCNLNLLLGADWVLSTYAAAGLDGASPGEA